MRSCGPCTICCHFFRVPETGKPENQWCGHCTDRGCAIHETRPQSCRNFECFWLMEENFPEDMRPDLCGIVVSFNDDKDSVVLHVDPDRPEALGEEAGEAWVEALLKSYRRLYIVCGEDRMMLDRDELLGNGASE
ncbi:hypothetical protein [Telmatospirillum sp. J64-1]|uniref:hypothetical protein n=1 Tax=Telmatospirillum sp. J64-1 TaxID=2502183 RepID=UPI00115F25C2|nr:hypothetical protein [Telmatospirillum sp. J64-1]